MICKCTALLSQRGHPCWLHSQVLRRSTYLPVVQSGNCDVLHCRPNGDFEGILGLSDFLSFLLPFLDGNRVKRVSIRAGLILVTVTVDLLAEADPPARIEGGADMGLRKLDSIEGKLHPKCHLLNDVVIYHFDVYFFQICVFG